MESNANNHKSNSKLKKTSQKPLNSSNSNEPLTTPNQLQQSPITKSLQNSATKATKKQVNQAQTNPELNQSRSLQLQFNDQREDQRQAQQILGSVITIATDAKQSATIPNQQQDCRIKQLNWNFSKSLQEEFGRLYTRNAQDLNSPSTPAGTQLYLVDSQWMQAFKGVYFPHLVPQSQQNQSILNSPCLPQSPAKLNQQSRLHLQPINSLAQNPSQILQTSESEINQQFGQLSSLSVPPLTNQRVVKSRTELIAQGFLLSAESYYTPTFCNSQNQLNFHQYQGNILKQQVQHQWLQFDHVMKEGLFLGLDFEPVSKQMWRILVDTFTNVNQLDELELNNESDQPLELVRSFEKLNIGVRTQLDYFYQVIQIQFVAKDTNMLEQLFNKQYHTYFRQFIQTNSNKFEFKVCFSEKRPIDELKARIVQILRDLATQAVQQQTSAAQIISQQPQPVQENVNLILSAGLQKLVASRLKLYITCSKPQKPLKDQKSSKSQKDTIFQLDSLEDVGKCLVGQILKQNSVLIVDVGTQDHTFAIPTNPAWNLNYKNIVIPPQNTELSRTQGQYKKNQKKLSQSPQNNMITNIAYQENNTEQNQIKIGRPMIYTKCNYCHSTMGSSNTQSGSVLNFNNQSSDTFEQKIKIQLSSTSKKSQSMTNFNKTAHLGKNPTKAGVDFNQYVPESKPTSPVKRKQYQTPNPKPSNSENDHEMEYTQNSGEEEDFLEEERPLAYSCNWCHRVFYCSELCRQRDELYHEETCMGFDNLQQWNIVCKPKSDARMGLTGIRNLTNSCYFSSSLQCLSHSLGLTSYFLQGHFRSELNPANPLGTQGKLAIGYAKLLKSLWIDNKDSIAPYQLKAIIGQFKRQFANQDQQDSQELLSVLLDGLHEDLNRVRNKPLVPMLESDGSDDVKAAHESWQNHLKRNQSVIVDLMHGLYKSTVQCPTCNKISVTFEPFLQLTLPIPELRMLQKQFFFVPQSTGERPVHHVLNIKSHKLVKQACSQIAKQFGTRKRHIELVLMQDDKILRILPKDELISASLTHPLFSQTTMMAVENLKPQKKINPMMEVWVNFHILENPREQPDKHVTKFPRLTTMNLEDSLIQAHLAVFALLRPMFLKYLETRERLNTDPRDWKALKKRKGIYGIPPMLTSECWNQMSLVEQYTCVFGPQDPSRRKLEDLPYFIKIVARRKNAKPNNKDDQKSQINPCNGIGNQPNGEDDQTFSRCVYCHREQCNGCPLQFDDKKTLKEYLQESGVPIKASFYRQEHRATAAAVNQITGGNNFGVTGSNSKAKRGEPSSSQKQKQKKTRAQLNRPSSSNQNGFNGELSEDLPISQEFELIVQLNAKRCWALYSYLDRFDHYKDSRFLQNRNAGGQGLGDDTEQINIYDCFRQFHKPENLSQANTWYCNSCVQHKQAVKKIQLYKTPPILIINFKRFRGSHAKQNMFVEFPIGGDENSSQDSQKNSKHKILKSEGLDLSDYLDLQQNGQKNNYQDNSNDCQRPIYDLFAVSNHFGQLQAGHYTAIVKNKDKWYQFNDHKITEVIDQSNIVTSSAYILFYQRRGIDFENLNFKDIQNKWIEYHNVNKATQSIPMSMPTSYIDKQDNADANLQHSAEELYLIESAAAKQQQKQIPIIRGEGSGADASAAELNEDVDEEDACDEARGLGNNSRRNIQETTGGT